MKSDPNEHLNEKQVVAFLGHELTGAVLRSVELHLTQCAECRDEIVSVTEILRPQRSGRRITWRVLAPTAAAAAAVILLVAGPLTRSGHEDVAPQHRDVPGQAANVPTPVSPIGPVTEVGHLVWRTVDGADRYRVTVYDSGGAVLWKEATEDTVIALPDSVQLKPAENYLWQLEARVGWDLWDVSDLIDFELEAGHP
jgi:hypothetical protein